MRWCLRLKQNLEALQAYFWDKNQKRGLGENFKECLDSKIESLKQNPETSSYILKHLRSSKTKRFLYNLIYRISDSHVPGNCNISTLKKS